MVAITVILAAVLGESLFGLGITSKLTEPKDQLVFDNTQVLLGVEYRSWDGSGGTENNGDIDHVYMDYQHGPVIDGQEIGSIILRWSGTDGKGGELRFVNPRYFDEETKQKYHDGDVGEFCTGNLQPGDRLVINMVHNKGQSGGKTNPEDIGVQYVESNWNQVDIVGKDPLFRTNGRYPIEFDGNRIIQEGDNVEVTILGPDHFSIIAQVDSEALNYKEKAKIVDNPEC
ncbi:hypothetical protein Metev_2327 (plasmid) [Methanohalobium evestigatum Z-7303]|uniref:Archaeal Type IV pilin N-terminal domain-containing protein n=1 Tax=Methanohalobium evestigatum (strain ATCC BAA-1072 / DSM 3721 / NBRC 107634 / OCM 161 / Z-7303) TaxID=644295 RepID=D7EC17_METEZ|nr:hypothetical protein Metev_2327 [Methanohalobium evestigatum Z-7303]